MLSNAVVFISGRDPLESLGGHGTYVRAHARAAIRAGFEPHIFSVSRRSHVLPSDFGVLHRTASLFRPLRQLMIVGHAPLLARSVERFAVEDRSRNVLIHGFGSFSWVGVTVSRRLQSRGIRAISLASAYGIYKREVRAMVLALDPVHGQGQRIRYRLEHLWTKHLVDRYERAGYTGSRLVLVNYDSVRRLLQSEYGLASGCRKIPYTSESAFLHLDTDRPSAARTQTAPLSATGPPWIVSVSRHDPRKGLEVLLYALARLRTAGIAFRAWLIGAGPILAYNRRLAARLGLEDIVTITGFVPDPYPYLRRADVFVLPSLQEGSGSLSLIEALHAGVPVVATNIDGIPEDVVDGESALLVQPGDAVALAAAIERLLIDPTLRNRLVAGGRATFEGRFSPVIFTEALREVYSDFGFTASPESQSLHRAGSNAAE